MQDYLKIFLVAAGIFRSAVISASIKSVVNFDVIGEGFHRTLRYTINFDGFNETDCAIALHILLPSSIYVNVDEVADLKRLGKALACSAGEIDVELFAEKAQPQNVTICEELKSSKTVSLSLPVHQRYQFSQNDGGYVSVEIPRPKLLLGCKDRLKNHRVSKIDLCSPCVELSSKWREIPYTTETPNNTWLIPVGDASHLNRVSYLTLLVTSLGAAAVLRSLLRSRYGCECGVKED